MDSANKKSKLNIIWVIVAAGLIIQAIYGEIDATNTLYKISKKVTKQCMIPTTNICDRVTLSYQISESTNNSLSVKWRRGLLSSILIVTIAKPLLGFTLDVKQSVLFVFISWTIIINFEGFNDYHMRKFINLAVNDCLFAAISDIGSQPGSNCDTELYNDVISRKRK